METITQFADLPTEIKELILEKLSNKEQKVIRTVCKEWQKILERKLTFKITLDDNSFELFKQFDENKIIAELTVRSFKSPLTSKSTTRSGLNKNIRCLSLGSLGGFPGDSRRDPNSPYIYLNQQVVCNFLPEEYGIAPGNLKLLLQMNPDIEELRLSATGVLSMIKESSVLKNLQLENLTVLDIAFGNFTTYTGRLFKQADVNPYTKLLQNFFPSLTTLHYSSQAWKADFRVWVALFQCVATHRKTLKKLKVFHTTVYTLQNSVELGKWFPEKKYEELRGYIREVNLDLLVLDLVKCGPNSGQRWRALEVDLLEAQSNLRNLVFIGNAREVVDVRYNRIFNSIRNSISYLELYWHCLFQPSFDCATLSECLGLKSLKLNIQRTMPSNNPNPDFYLNIRELPKGIVNLLFGQMIKDEDALWISRNLVQLEEIVYVSLRRNEETERTLEHFLEYLKLPNLKTFRIHNFRCHRIALLVQNTPGLTMQNSNSYLTNVILDRNILR